VTNTGTADSGVVTADVSLPPGVTYVGLESSGGGFESGGFLSGRLLLAHHSDGWTCTPVASGATCTHAALATGHATSAYLDVAAAPGSQGTIAPSVTISAPGLASVTVSGSGGVQDHGLSARYASTGPLTVTEVGNALLSCPAAAAGCAQARLRLGNQLNDASWPMTAYDGDTDPTTTASSGATLSLPSEGNVRWAGLYWSGSWTGASTETIKLRTPGAASYQSVTADRVDTATGSGFTAFQAYTDVTALVAAAGGGDWWAADPQVVAGAGTYAGWSLVVVADTHGAPDRQVSVFDGMSSVDQASGPISLAGPVLTAGPVRIGSVVWNGDAGSTGDSLTLGGVALTPQGGSGDPDNFADSSSAGALGSPLTFGTDVTSFVADAPAGAPIVAIRSTGETLFAGVVTVTGG